MARRHARSTCAHATFPPVARESAAVAATIAPVLSSGGRAAEKSELPEASGGFRQLCAPWPMNAEVSGVGRAGVKLHRFPVWKVYILNMTHFVGGFWTELDRFPKYIKIQHTRALG